MSSDTGLSIRIKRTRPFWISRDMGTDITYAVVRDPVKCRHAQRDVEVLGVNITKLRNRGDCRRRR